MRNQLYILAIFFLLASCNYKNQSQSYPTLNKEDIVPAIGFAIPDSNTRSPVVITVHHPKIVNAGKPIIIPYNTDPKNISPTITKSVHLLPTKTKPPAIVNTSIHTVIAGTPEIIVAKDASFNDNDPANFSSFKSLQGLRQPLIRSMMQDANGNIWFGSYSGGICKYDGKYFTNYTIAQGLSNDGVWSIIEDHCGNIWMGTLGGGLIKFDGTYFTTYKTTEGLPDNTVYCLCEDDNGKIWIGTQKGLSVYDGKMFSNYQKEQGLPATTINAIVKDSHGSIWLGTSSGAAKFNGQSFEVFSDENVLAVDAVNTIFIDNTNIWFGTNNALIKWSDDVCTNYSFNTKLTDIGKDLRGNLWITTQGDGVYKVNKDQFTHFTSHEGLSNDKVICTLIDRSGTIWFGTNGGGACRYDGELFTHFTTMQGLAYNEIKGIVEDKTGNLWFASWGGGLSKYDGKYFQNYSVAQGLVNNGVLSIFYDSKGNLWLGTENGISKYDGKTFINYDTAQGFTSKQIWNIAEDADHNMWFGSFGDGAFKFDGTKFTHYSVGGLNNAVVMCLLQDKSGNMWFGTYGNGLYKYDGKTFINYNHNGGLSSDEVMNMMQDSEGNLWVGTIGGGANKYDGKTFTHYSKTQGLSNEIVMGFLEDRNKNLWISTRNGLNRMINRTVPADKNDQPIFKNYLFEDGLLGVNAYVNALYEDRRGNIWIGTGGRLTCCTPHGEIPDTISPTIQLTGVSLYNEKINWQSLQDHQDTSLLLHNGVKLSNFKFDCVSKWYNVPEHLRLSYKNNYLVFNYIGVSMKSPYNVKYQYMLEGVDKNWNALTDRTDAPYGNLPHGKYKFKVKAMNSEGFWSNEYDYAFEVLPAWWQTWWFSVILIVFVIAAIYGIYKYRLRQILSLQKIRNRIASDLHDDIGSTLNSISVYSEVAKSDPDKRDMSLAMIGESSRKVIDAMSDIVWAINPDNDSFEKVLLRMRSLAYNLLRAKNIEFSFKSDDSLNDLKLPLEKRRNLYLIYKETLNNLIKHADAKTAQIVLSNRGNTINLLVKDFGKGFDVHAKYAGNGLINIRKRAEELNAILSVVSSHGNGTEIELSFKS